MRTIDIDPPELPSGIDPHVGLASEKFDISLITPIYGGGAVAGLHDHDFAIRPTSIRGQLRFWWRATAGAQFAAVSQLLQQETLIFGSTSRPSPLNLQVSILKARPWALSAPAYAEFPFREIPDKKNSFERPFGAGHSLRHGAGRGRPQCRGAAPHAFCRHRQKVFQSPKPDNGNGAASKLTKKALLDRFCRDSTLLQVGGNATVGRGRLQCHFTRSHTKEGGDA